MHPIERLRYVARAGGAPPSSLVSEAASALAGLAEDPAALVTACRRLVERHPGVGPMWWLASRVLTAPEPVAEAWAVVGELDRDPTAKLLAAELGESAAVVVLGWPELVGSALMRRGDLVVMLVDEFGEADGLIRRLRGAGGDVVEVGGPGLAQAVAAADVVLVEAMAMGAGPASWGVDSGATMGVRAAGAPDAGAHDAGSPADWSVESGAVVASGSWAAAAVARSAGVPVWLVAGAGRVLPARIWEAVVRRLDDDPAEPWDRAWEVLPADLVSSVLGPEGPVPWADALLRADCPIAAELLTPVGARGA
ncbi:MAG: hypothetical protein ACRDY2_03310 [Acidimicrobiales bacterium]